MHSAMMKTMLMFAILAIALASTPFYPAMTMAVPEAAPATDDPPARGHDAHDNTDKSLIKRTPVPRDPDPLPRFAHGTPPTLVLLPGPHSGTGANTAAAMAREMEKMPSVERTVIDPLMLTTSSDSPYHRGLAYFSGPIGDFSGYLILNFTVPAAAVRLSDDTAATMLVPLPDDLDIDTTGVTEAPREAKGLPKTPSAAAGDGEERQSSWLTRHMRSLADLDDCRDNARVEALVLAYSPADDDGPRGTAHARLRTLRKVLKGSTARSGRALLMRLPKDMGKDGRAAPLHVCLPLLTIPYGFAAPHPLRLSLHATPARYWACAMGSCPQGLTSQFEDMGVERFSTVVWTTAARSQVVGPIAGLKTAENSAGLTVKYQRSLALTPHEAAAGEVSGLTVQVPTAAAGYLPAGTVLRLEIAYNRGLTLPALVAGVGEVAAGSEEGEDKGGVSSRSVSLGVDAEGRLVGTEVEAESGAAPIHAPAGSLADAVRQWKEESRRGGGGGINRRREMGWRRFGPTEDEMRAAGIRPGSLVDRLRRRVRGGAGAGLDGTHEFHTMGRGLVDSMLAHTRSAGAGEKQPSEMKKSNSTDSPPSSPKPKAQRPSRRVVASRFDSGGWGTARCLLSIYDREDPADTKAVQAMARTARARMEAAQPEDEDVCRHPMTAMSTGDWTSRWAVRGNRSSAARNATVDATDDATDDAPADAPAAARNWGAGRTREAQAIQNCQTGDCEMSWREEPEGPPRPVHTLGNPRAGGEAMGDWLVSRWQEPLTLLKARTVVPVVNDPVAVLHAHAIRGPHEGEEHRPGDIFSIKPRVERPATGPVPLPRSRAVLLAPVSGVYNTVDLRLEHAVATGALLAVTCVDIAMPGTQIRGGEVGLSVLVPEADEAGEDPNYLRAAEPDYFLSQYSRARLPTLPPRKLRAEVRVSSAEVELPKSQASANATTGRTWEPVLELVLGNLLMGLEASDEVVVRPPRGFDLWLTPAASCVVVSDGSGGDIHGKPMTTMSVDAARERRAVRARARASRYDAQASEEAFEATGAEAGHGPLFQAVREAGRGVLTEAQWRGAWGQALRAQPGAGEVCMASAGPGEVAKQLRWVKAERSGKDVQLPGLLQAAAVEGAGYEALLWSQVYKTGDFAVSVESMQLGKEGAAPVTDEVLVLRALRPVRAGTWEEHSDSWREIGEPLAEDRARATEAARVDQEEAEQAAAMEEATAAARDRGEVGERGNATRPTAESTPVRVRVWHGPSGAEGRDGLEFDTQWGAEDVAVKVRCTGVGMAPAKDSGSGKQRSHTRVNVYRGRSPFGMINMRAVMRYGLTQVLVAREREERRAAAGERVGHYHHHGHTPRDVDGVPRSCSTNVWLRRLERARTGRSVEGEEPGHVHKEGERESRVLAESLFQLVEGGGDARGEAGESLFELPFLRRASGTASVWVDADPGCRGEGNA